MKCRTQLDLRRSRTAAERVQRDEKLRVVSTAEHMEHPDTLKRIKGLTHFSSIKKK